MEEVKQLWRFVTETGREYVIDEHGLVVMLDNGPYRFRHWDIVDRYELFNGEHTKVPTIGYSVRGIDFSGGWRLSSKIVSVEKLEG